MSCVMLHGKITQRRTPRAAAVKGWKVCQPLGVRRRKRGFGQNMKSSVLGWGTMFSRQLAPYNANPASWVCAVRSQLAHGDVTDLLIEQYCMGRVSLVSPTSICLLGLGLWHRFLWHEVRVLSFGIFRISSLVVFEKAEQHTGAAQSALGSPELLYISWAAFQNVLGTCLPCSGLGSSHEAHKKL